MPLCVFSWSQSLGYYLSKVLTLRHGHDTLRDTSMQFSSTISHLLYITNAAIGSTIRIRLVALSCRRDDMAFNKTHF